MSMELKTYVVLYRVESIMSPQDPPFGFRCDAKDADHAEEQCVNAEPDCDVVWIDEGEDYREALQNYWNEGVA